MTAILQCFVRCVRAAGDQVRRRHQAVGVLMVLVDADAVEAQFVGVGQRV